MTPDAEELDQNRPIVQGNVTEQALEEHYRAWEKVIRSIDEMRVARDLYLEKKSRRRLFSRT